MPSLKDLKDRIASVNSTRKITSAMKMVAAAKLRRAQEQAEAGRPYAERMRTLLANLAAGSHADLALLQGTGSEQTQLIVLATADRGLAGGFNTNLIRDPLRLIPFRLDEAEDNSQADSSAAATLHDYEPNEADILADLLPRNIAVQIYRGLLENAASEQGARMTAMDNATRNAGDMVGQLTLLYNRTRQAQITKELIEIVSGAEAL
jgi:F0F1-type ATP synthase gamma subunit